MSARMKSILSGAAAFVVVYFSLNLLIYIKPQWFLYAPSKTRADLTHSVRLGYGAKEVRYNAIDGQELYGWYAKARGNNNGKVVLFFHGNAYNVEMFYGKLIPFLKAGYNVFLPEYRGFGGLGGNITDNGLVLDAMAAVNELYEMGYKNQDIVVYGLSLGSHMATSAVYNFKDNGQFNALILEVPFNSVPDVVSNIVPIYLPSNIIIKDRYDNESIINDIDTRLLILAAEQDKLVPYRLAQKLYNQAAEPKDMIVYEGAGHNDLYDYANYEHILMWLDSKK